MSKIILLNRILYRRFVYGIERVQAKNRQFIKRNTQDITLVGNKHFPPNPFRTKNRVNSEELTAKLTKHRRNLHSTGQITMTITIINSPSQKPFLIILLHLHPTAFRNKYVKTYFK